MLGRVDAGGTLHEDHSHTRLLPLVGCIVGAVVGFAKDLVASIDQGWRHAFASVGGVGVGSCFVEPLFLPSVLFCTCMLRVLCMLYCYYSLVGPKASWRRDAER